MRTATTTNHAAIALRRRRGLSPWAGWAAWLWLLAGLWLVPSARAVPLPLGDVVSASARADGVDFALADGATLGVWFLPDGIVRFEAVPNGRGRLPTGAVILDQAAPGKPDLFGDPGRLIVRHADWLLIVNRSPLQVVAMRRDGSVVAATLPGGLLHDPATGVVVLRHYARPGERYLGLGLAGGLLDRRGRKLTMRNSDRAAYEELTNPLYSSTPFFYGQFNGAVHGFFFDNPSVAEFDMAASADGVVSIAAVAGTLNWYLLSGPKPQDVARSFAALTGATPVPPRWAIGYQQAHFGYASAAEVLSLAREFRSRRIPADAFYLDLDYTDRLFTMTWNPIGWPDPVAFNAEMATLGFQRVNILEPLVTVFDPLWPWLAGNRWLVRAPDGSALVTPIWMGDVSFIDFTQTAAREFFRRTLRSFVSTGVSGIWADLNEPAANELPYAVFDFDGRPRYDHATRNIYALWNVAAIRDALLDARPGVRPFIVSRSGFAGIQRYAANWSGDTDSTWDSLRVQVQIANSMGLSGQNFFGADIGGFLGAPDGELFIRWLQFGSATPYMRNHSMNTSPLREPWRFGEPYTAVAKATIEWRYRLMPYLYGLFVAAEAQGAPVLAPTWFHFPLDPATSTGSGEFMLGPSMLLAPVVERGATTRRLRLPAGADWIDYHRDTIHVGGSEITVPAPLHQMPGFVRAGSIVPMGPVRQYANEPLPEDSLVLDVFPGAEARFSVRDDDGTTDAYRRGVYRDTEWHWTEGPLEAVLAARSVGGQAARTSRIHWVQVRRWLKIPARVSVDGQALPGAATPAAIGKGGGWYHDPSTRRLLVRLPGTTPPAQLRIER